MSVAARFSGPGQPYEGLAKRTAQGPQWTNVVRTVPEKLDEPLRWQRPRRVFVNSMSDLWHPEVPFEYVDQVFAVMALAHQHTFQVLTKRPERMRDYLKNDREKAVGHIAFRMLCDTPSLGRHPWMEDRSRDPGNPNIFTKLMFGVLPNWPLSNVWLGVSAEDQKAADERIPFLLQAPAAVRWISAEPLLGPVDLGATYKRYAESRVGGVGALSSLYEGLLNECYHCDAGETPDGYNCPFCHGTCMSSFDRIDWVVVGGESGPGARPCNIEWIRCLVQQCKSASAPVFVKQLGAYPITEKAGGFLGRMMLSDAKGGNMDEWPEDLRVRQYPQEGGAQ